MASTLAGRVHELRFPVKRAYRRWLRAFPGAPWMAAAMAFAGGLTLCQPSRRRRRLAAGVCLLGGAVLGLFLGDVPGRGWRGSVLSLWVAGALAGGAAALAVSRVQSIRRRLDRGGPALAEDLVRFSLDFRHSGIEARTLVSIRGRAQNLFRNGELCSTFLADLRSLSASFSAQTSVRLKSLVDQVRLVFPDLRQAKSLADLAARLERTMAELPRLVQDVERLQNWVDRVQPLVHETRTALDSLLHSIDLRCSSDVCEVVSRALELCSEELTQAQVDVRVSRQGDGVLTAMITSEHLLLILENLLTNALGALENRNGRRIDISMSREAKRVRLRVRDNGRGVPAARADQIFEYDQVRGRGRAGYGLPRSRDILQHFGGTLALEECDQGASFVITLRTVSSG